MNLRDLRDSALNEPKLTREHAKHKQTKWPDKSVTPRNTEKTRLPTAGVNAVSISTVDLPPISLLLTEDMKSATCSEI